MEGFDYIKGNSQATTTAVKMFIVAKNIIKK